MKSLIEKYRDYVLSNQMNLLHNESHQRVADKKAKEH